MSRPRKVSFRIRREYYDEIVAGTKKEELRNDKPFWRKRLVDPMPEEAVFICGKDMHRRRIIGVLVAQDPVAYLGRPLSIQGRKDIRTALAIVVQLGEEIRS